MTRKTWGLSALVGLAAWSSVALAQSALAQASKEEAMVELISVRLSMMKEVAAYKYGKDLPIEDPAREAVVLEASVEKAKALGLDGATVLPFFERQIAAAKAVQACWMARWRNGNGKALRFPRDLQTELRPQLIEIGDKIDTTLAGALAGGAGLDDARLAKARDLLSLDCLAPETGDALIESLLGVKPAAP